MDGDSWVWWLVRSFVTGAPLSTEPHVPGAGSVPVAVARLGAVAAGLGVGFAYVAGPSSPDAVWVAWGSWAAAAAVLMAVGWWAAEWVATWRHRRRWVVPLDVALRPLAGWPDNLPASRWLEVPVGLLEEGDVVRVQLPAAFVGRDEQRKLIERTVTSKLGLGDVAVTWRLVSREHCVEFRAKARPPRWAFFRDTAVGEVVAAARESRPVIGLAAGGRPVGVDLDSESPHMVVSAGTGAGKSNMLRVVAAQLMHRGASLVVLDLKRRSHRWARGPERVKLFEAGCSGFSVLSCRPPWVG